MQPNGPNQHTQQPIVTGTSVVAIKFKDGVVIAADNLGMNSAAHQNIYNSFSARKAVRGEGFKEHVKEPRVR
jgi:20S proteasome alpha/beta subunit